MSGIVDANLCTGSRGGTHPHDQQLAETKACIASQFKCPLSATKKIIETTGTDSSRKKAPSQESEGMYL